VNARRWFASLAASGLVLFGSLRAPLADSKPSEWTPEKLLEFVSVIDHIMELLYVQQDEREHPRLTGSCRGFPVDGAIKRSRVVSLLRPVLGGKALNCYLATYLGCDVKGWIARPMSSVVGAELKPFKRSKVTIVEQTPDRIVVDITELPYEEVTDGVATAYLGEDEKRPFTDAEIGAITDKSRYTLTRGKDGHWRITDRKPSFKWICDGALDPN
jgi:hypothetical protein